MKINEVLDDNDLDRVIDDCSDALSMIKENVIIYRGLRIPGPKNIKYIYKPDKPKFQKDIEVSGPEFFKIDPKKITRTSVDTRNYYNLLLDNLPSWRNYPKRSHSLICTTSLKKAKRFGYQYLVLPLNGAKIAICPMPDIWQVMTNFFKYRFNIRSGREFKSLNIDYERLQLSDSSYISFLDSALDKFPIIYKMLFEDWPSEYLEYTNFKNIDNIQDLEKFFDILYNPTLCGFKLSTINNFDTKSSNFAPGFNYNGSQELWTDSESYLIDINSNLYKKLMGNNYENH